MPHVPHRLPGGQRHEHTFVHIGVVGAEVAGDDKRLVANSEPLPNRVEAFAEQLAAGGPADHGSVRTFFKPASQPLPAVNVRERRVDAANLRKEPAMGRLRKRAIVDPSGDVLYTGNLPDGAGILGGERGCCAQPGGNVHALAATGEVARAHLDDVGAG